MNVLELNGITKRFGNLAAVDNVDFDLKTGEIHAVLGENGAGKSTLMNLIYGMHQPDNGEIRISGEPTRLDSPRDAIVHGVGMVHQHFLLIQNLTVAENIALGTRDQGFRFRRDEANQKTRQLSEQFGFAIDSESYIWQLPVGLQQRVEILKALAADARILILDEPTAVLAPQEVDELFSILRRLKADDRSIIFISHKLKEVMTISDRVTVMRNGSKTYVTNTADTSTEELARQMMGNEPPDSQDDTAVIEEVADDDAALHLQDVVIRGNQAEIAVQGVSLEVRRGEIVGIAGVDGNGQVELAEALIGLRKVISGDIRLFDTSITNKTTADIRGLGVGYIPGDRQSTGLVVNFSISENLILDVHHLREHRKRVLLDKTGISDDSERLIRNYDIRTPSADIEAHALSGGNQQKIVLAREISRNPALLIAVNPTRGLDINAAEYVHKSLIAQRQASKAVLLISTELDEALALSDRMFVMSNGNLIDATSKRSDMTALGLLMTGAETHP
jgi:simple sugar transport system ATP-binding protein